MSRALRRHHRERLKRNRRYYHTRPSSFCYQNSPEQIAFYVDTPCPCSCDMCGNPRRSLWNQAQRRTLAERRFLSEDVMPI